MCTSYKAVKGLQVAYSEITLVDKKKKNMRAYNFASRHVAWSERCHDATQSDKSKSASAAVLWTDSGVQLPWQRVHRREGGRLARGTGASFCSREPMAVVTEGMKIEGHNKQVNHSLENVMRGIYFKQLLLSGLMKNVNNRKLCFWIFWQSCKFHNSIATCLLLANDWLHHWACLRIGDSLIKSEDGEINYKQILFASCLHDSQNICQGNIGKIGREMSECLTL